MKAVKTYSARIDADLAKIALDAADVPSVVVGTGVAMEGRVAGVQLLVPDEYVEAGAEGARTFTTGMQAYPLLLAWRLRSASPACALAQEDVLSPRYCVCGLLFCAPCATPLSQCQVGPSFTI